MTRNSNTEAAGLRCTCRGYTAFGLIALAVILGVGTVQGQSRWNVRDHFAREDLVIQSHRGAGYLAEENTVEAFRVGWGWGTIPEADVRTSRDGVLVAFHDTTFERMQPHASAEVRAQGVQDLTLAELKELDVGAWKGPEFAGRKIPTLAEVFAEMQGDPRRKLYLDVKRADLAQLAAEVEAAGVAGQVILASRHVARLRTWRELLPAGETLLWMRGNEPELDRRLEVLSSEGFAGITQVQLHIHPAEGWSVGTEPSAVDAFALSDDFLVRTGETLRSHGVLYQTLPFFAGDWVYARLLDLGVASFATDYPDVTVGEVERYYGSRPR